MARPIAISIPHNLGQAEARRRIEAGFGQMRQQMTGGLASMVAFQERWDGNCLQFEGGALGQTMRGRLDVRDDAVAIEIDLPAILAALGDRIAGQLKREGQRLLGSDR